MHYIARLSDKAGRPRFLTLPHASRVDAARQVFDLFPEARTVSTGTARPDGRGEAHGDVQWHHRAAVMP